MVDVFRFAPSPNGQLHLGHALSAMLNFDMARARSGRFLLRIEDIDPARCRPEFEEAIYRDLLWLGLTWEEPVRRQSEHVDSYRTALETLVAHGLAYPAFLSRTEIRAHVAAFEASGGIWPRDPDGSPHYPSDERSVDPDLAATRIAAGQRHMWRLNMDRALGVLQTPLFWSEGLVGAHTLVSADPAAWGDVVLWRWDAPSSYHLSVVIDDAFQGITHVVRGMDLYHATSVHRLLQHLLGLPAPTYHHHRLVVDNQGRKLSKSTGSMELAALRREGASPSDIRRRVGLAI